MSKLIIPSKIDFFCNLTTFQEFNKFYVLPLSHFDSHEKPTLNRYWHFKLPECQNLQNCSSNPESDKKNTLYIAKIHPVYLTFWPWNGSKMVPNWFWNHFGTYTRPLSLQNSIFRTWHTCKYYNISVLRRESHLKSHLSIQFSLYYIALPGPNGISGATLEGPGGSREPPAKNGN